MPRFFHRTGRLMQQHSVKDSAPVLVKLVVISRVVNFFHDNWDGILTDHGKVKHLFIVLRRSCSQCDPGDIFYLLVGYEPNISGDKLAWVGTQLAQVSDVFDYK